MTKHLSIFLGDLTHETIGIATELIPLNIGYVAAYLKAQFKDRVDVRLFKYVPDLEQAIDAEPPDLLALSNYPWNDGLGTAMFERLHKRRPEALRIKGGPNFPHGVGDQEVYLSQRRLIDSYMHLDGEVPTKNFVDFVFSVGELADVRSAMLDQTIKGCVHFGGDGGLLSDPEPIRLKDLDEIPSPYLTGLLDPFFDGKLTPIMQTNRGCPFKCTFCSDGTDLVNKVTQFSLDRVKAEINYIAERVPKNVTSLFMSDLNFGMLKRDGEICEEFARVRSKYGYPSDINQSTGKNSKDRIIRNVETLSGAIMLSMAVQSLTPEVLKNIKRDNIKISDYLELAPSIREANLPVFTEIILGLPGETKETHIESLRVLLNMGIDFVTPYSLLLVNGSEMATPAERSKWGFVTKFRVIPLDFTRFDDGQTVVETEEVVIETNTMSFSDYVECRKIALMITLINNRGFKALLFFMIQNGLMVTDLLIGVVAKMDALAPSENGAKGLLQDFERETVDELWDSPEELNAFFAREENFQGLVEGRYGANLINTYRARFFAHCMEEIADHAFDVAREMFGEQKSELLPMLNQIENYCRARTFDLFGENRLDECPEVTVDYDISSWVADKKQRPIDAFAFAAPRTARFKLTSEQYSLVEDGLNRYGHSDIGRGKLLTRLNPDALWREPNVGAA
jgi:uncharacterized radical SAM superfamily protein